MSKAKSAEKVVQDIRRKTRRRFSAEEKIRIVLEGPAGRREYRDAVPSRRPQSESLLSVEQGVPRSREETSGRGYDPRSHVE